METNKIILYSFSIAILAIGLYMTVSYAGKAIPPTLSGIAFILIGIKALIQK